MRSNLIETLENRIKILRKKRAFHENMSLKHIPGFQVFLNSLLEKAQNYCNETCNDIDDQIKEIEDIIDDLCCLNADK